MRLLCTVVLLTTVWCQSSPDYNKQLEGVLLKDYNSHHRPVQKEQTTVQVSVYMSISHVEKVDEHEQTMLVHGHLWATWTDEYLKWTPSSYNNTNKISIDSWKLWQPALALYNSARGNSWHLYMNGLPAMVASDGRVWLSGSFSFHVTCLFDFSAWPYDEQECPIVVSDWVYDLSKVNLSDPEDNAWSKPSLRMNYDPLRQKEKRHVSGWEVTDTWRKHCYWGPSGCKEEVPDGQPDWYWSLLEFGVKLKRHAPYFGLTIILPTFITCFLTLSSFWIDTISISTALLIFNVLLQGLFGWDLIRELPPGSGSVPKIVSLYGFNLCLTTIAFVFHVVIQYLETVLPKNLQLPQQIWSVTQVIRIDNFFKAKGLSFDPQLLLSGEMPEEDVKEFNSPLASLETTALNENDNAVLIPMETGDHENVEVELSDQQPEHSSPTPKNSLTGATEPADGSTSHTLYQIRRFLFILYAVAYIIAMPICMIPF